MYRKVQGQNGDVYSCLHLHTLFETESNKIISFLGRLINQHVKNIREKGLKPVT